MRKGPIVALAVGAGILALGVVALLAMPTLRDALRPRETLTDQAVIAKTARGYVNNPYKDDYGNSRIAGYVDNLSDSRLSRVVFEIRLLDAQGNQREKVAYAVEDVAPRARTTFDANAGQIAGARSAQASIVEIEVVR